MYVNFEVGEVLQRWKVGELCLVKFCRGRNPSKNKTETAIKAVPSHGARDCKKTLTKIASSSQICLKFY